MALTDPWPVVSGMADAFDIRQAHQSTWSRPGVVPYSKPGDSSAMPSIVFASSNMTPVLRVFNLVTARSTVETGTGPSYPDGFSTLRNADATGAPTFATAPASGARLDTLVVHTNDNLQGDGATSPQWLIRPGNATTGTPQQTTLLPGDTEIATVLIPAGATGLNSSGVVITHTYKAAQLVGGPLFVRALTELSGPTVGLKAIVPSSNLEVEYRYDGAVWRIWNRPPTDFTPQLRTAGLNWGASGGITKCESTVTDGWVSVHFRARFSGTGVAWGSIFYPLEVQADQWAMSDMYGAGIVIVNDANGGVYQAPVQLIADGTTHCFQILRQGADNGAAASWASSQPFQPATGDTIAGTFRYRAA